MAGIQDLLTALLTRQGPSPMTMGSGPPASADFGANGPPQDETSMRPEDLIVSPDPSQPRSREQRMEGIRRMLTDFTFQLGSGMSAASQNPRGRAQRTMAGQGAILQVPEFLRRAQEAEKVRQETEKQNIVKLILQKRQADTAEAGQQSLADYRLRQDQNADQTNTRLTTQGTELADLKKIEADRKAAADAAALAEKNKPKKLDTFDGEDEHGRPVRVQVMQYPDGSIRYESGPQVHEKPKPSKLLTPEEEAQAVRLAKAKGVARDQVIQVQGENGSSSFAIINKQTGEIRPTTPTGDITNTPKLSDAQVKTQTNAKSGLAAIATLREELKKPGMLAEMALPKSVTARKARAARNEMVDVLTRIRTGAALNNEEQAFYDDQAPGLIDALFGNDPADIEYKLGIFENQFKALSGVKSKPAVIEQVSPSTQQYRHSLDGGKTWISGRAPK